MMRAWLTRLRRRPRVITQQQLIEADGVLLDLPRRRAQVDGHLVHLPAREAALLGLLLTHAGQIVYRPALAAAAGHPTRHATANWTGCSIASAAESNPAHSHPPGSTASATPATSSAQHPRRAAN